MAAVEGDGGDSEDLQCPICFDFMVEPVRTRCGHAFCRLCLYQSTMVSPDGRHCPLCRANIDGEVFDGEGRDATQTDAELERRLLTVVPSATYEERREANNAAISVIAKISDEDLPVFLSTEQLPVDQGIALHLFEPRYKVLVRRALEGSRRFVIARAPTSLGPQTGDRATLVDIIDCQILPDGRANLRGVGIREVVLRKTWVAETPSYHGLWLCNLSPSDLPPPRRRGWWANGSQQQLEANALEEQAAASGGGVGYGDGGGGGGGRPSTAAARTGQPNAYPVFYLSRGCRVGRTVDLMLFEPRYQMMMQRIMGNDAGQCDRLFVFASARPTAGMEATLVLVQYANMLADGRCQVQGKGQRRVMITDTWEEDSMHGLMWCIAADVTRRAGTMGRRTSGEGRRASGEGRRASGKCVVS